MNTMKNYEAMTTEEIRQRMNELSNILDAYMYGGKMENWDEAYDEYSKLGAILDKRYREENQEKFDAFYKKYIEGKTWEEIDPEDWSYYSDWHKDMYGFRPRHI